MKSLAPIALAILVLLSPAAIAQQEPTTAGEYGVIAGKVTEADGTPIENTIIIARLLRPSTEPTTVQAPESTTTDENGNYSLKLPAGKYEVKAWAEGFRGEVATVEVEAGRTLELNFVLEPWLGLGKEVVAALKELLVEHRSRVEGFIQEVKYLTAKAKEQRLSLIDNWRQALSTKLEGLNAERQELVQRFENGELSREAFVVAMRELAAEVKAAGKSMGELGERLGALGAELAENLKLRAAELVLANRELVEQAFSMGLKLGSKLREQGFYPERVEEAVEEAYERVAELAEDFREEIKEVVKQTLEQISEGARELKRRISELVRENLREQIATLVENFRDQVRQRLGRRLRILELVENLRENCLEILEENLERCEELVEEFHEFIEEALEENLEEAEELLEEDEDVEEFYELMMEIRELASELAENLWERVEPLVKEAEEAFAKGEVSLAIGLLQKAKRMLEHLLEMPPMPWPEIPENLPWENLPFMPWPEIPENLPWENLPFPEPIENIPENQPEIPENLPFPEPEEEIKEKLEELWDELRDLLEEMAELALKGIDVSEVRELLDLVQSELQELDLAEAAKLLEEAREAIENLKKTGGHRGHGAGPRP